MTSSDTSTPRRRRRRIGVLIAVFATLMAGAVVFAAWLSTGSGDSQDVTAGTAASLSVSPVTPAVTGLVPSGSKVSSFTVSNNNSYQVTLTSVEVDSITVTGGTGCTAANADITTTVNPSAVGTDVAGGGSPVSDASFTVTVAMGPDSDNGCQGATFTPNLSVAGTSS
jgi:hypothetical protein